MSSIILIQINMYIHLFKNANCAMTWIHLLFDENVFHIEVIKMSFNVFFSLVQVVKCLVVQLYKNLTFINNKHN